MISSLPVFELTDVQEKIRLFFVCVLRLLTVQSVTYQFSCTESKQCLNSRFPVCATSQLLFFVRNLLVCSSQFSSPNTSSDLPPCFQQHSATGCLSAHSRGATGKHHIFVNKLEISRDLQMVGAPLQLTVDQRYFS